MTHRVQHSLEAIILGLSLHWQPLFGIAASVAAILYYGSVLKMNVVDKVYDGSWKKYFKSFFKF